MVVVSSVTRLRKPIDDRPGDKSKVASERVAGEHTQGFHQVYRSVLRK